jgi:hypothetical protein
MTAARRLARVAATGLALVAAAPALAEAVTIDDPVITGARGDDGWFVGPVTVRWSVSGAARSDCPTTTVAADTDGTTVSCTAEDADGGRVSRSTPPLRVDRTAPAGVAVTAGRAPDAGPWYRAPVALTWSGQDATSGVAACTTATYAGPDTSAARPSGTCRDRAGNVSAPVALLLAYDATPPALTGVRATAGPAGATLRWRATDGAAAFAVLRRAGAGAPVAVRVPRAAARAGRLTQPGLPTGVRYRWTITATDAAGNAGTADATAVPGPPRLRWRAARHARFYNVQLFRAGHKRLSAWPRRPALQVRRAWRFGGRARHLGAGTWRWYVWPGYGSRTRPRYGRLLARGRFEVR